MRRTAADIRRFERRVSRDLLLIGDNLTVAKLLLGHGRFGGWLVTEFGWTPRTAERFMRAAKVFGARNDAVATLGPTAIYTLSAPSTPEPVQQAFVARLEAGERLSLNEIREVTQAARQAARLTRRVRAKLAKVHEPLSPAAEKARAAADLILGYLGERRDELVALLENIDGAALVDLLRKGATASNGVEEDVA
ncbi:DUF3102 domain-containing protein [Methylobacterium sp. E-005]|uniref:DUF3102 domain-containing protein n=1 Tax=Methylobacterium sp. E-005 TaxID=2836549 RepID=UPI001FB9A7B4|nr:DUF3102 domain-containing protein [Methylobacterium sp. E-005]MCJ2086735.1 DUF3102 domain-containing protein [Methylobacterium sp. E-005]